MIPLLIGLLIALIGLSVWNLYSLRDLKKYNRSYRELKDDRYYELKYKNEYITTITIVVFGVGSFFGYKFFEDFKKDASDKLKYKTDSLSFEIKSLRMSLNPIRDSVNEYKNIVNKLKSDQNDVGNNIQNSYGQLFQLKREINTISNKNIVKQDFYISDNLKFSLSGKGVITKIFYFNKLKTLVGEPFPTFEKTPFLVVVPENSAVLALEHLNKDYFEVSCGEYAEPLDSAMFGIMVSKK